jgi:hypothetical protein
MTTVHFPKGEAVSVRRKLFTKETGKVIEVITAKAGGRESVTIWVRFPCGRIERFSPAEGDCCGLLDQQARALA